MWNCACVGITASWIGEKLNQNQETPTMQRVVISGHAVAMAELTDAIGSCWRVQYTRCHLKLVSWE